jgi:CHAD domain-containing protein
MSSKAIRMFKAPDMTDATTNEMIGESATAVLELPLEESAAEKKKAQTDVREWTRLQEFAQGQIDKFLQLVPSVLRDEDHLATHKLRVTCRRVEHVLDLLYPKPRPGYAREFQRNVKRCRHAVGEIRNCDVLLSLCESSIARHDSDREAWQAALEYLKDRRARHTPKVLKELGGIEFSSHYLKIKRDLNSAVVSVDGSNPHETNGNGRKHWDVELMRRSLALSAAQRWRIFEAEVAKSRRNPCEPVIHGVRIAAKRLKYVVELMTELDIAGSPEILAWITTVQHAIGEWHDLEVLEHMMLKVLAHKKFLRGRRELVSPIEKLILKNKAIKLTSEESFARMTSASSEYRNAQLWIGGLRSTARPRN